MARRGFPNWFEVNGEKQWDSCQGERGEDAKAVHESQQAHLILMKEAALRS